jgi:DivIVA domain-containing protein
VTTMLQEEIAKPEFAVAVRGYDRAQVDEFVAQALEWLADWEARAADAEMRARSMSAELHEMRRLRAELAEQSGLPSPGSVTSFSERMSAVLQSAVDAAEQLRVDSAREAGERKTQIAEECHRMVERASEEAEQIVVQARAKEQELGKQLADLDARRAAAMGDLAKLHRQLSSLIEQGQPPTDSPAQHEAHQHEAQAPEPTAAAEAKGQHEAMPQPQDDATQAIPRVATAAVPEETATADPDRTLVARTVTGVRRKL